MPSTRPLWVNKHLQGDFPRVNSATRQSIHLTRTHCVPAQAPCCPQALGSGRNYPTKPTKNSPLAFLLCDGVGRSFTTVNVVSCNEVASNPTIASRGRLAWEPPRHSGSFPDRSGGPAWVRATPLMSTKNVCHQFVLISFNPLYLVSFFKRRVCIKETCIMGVKAT